MGLSSKDIDGHDRKSVYTALRSFDHTGMGDAEFTVSVFGLLAPDAEGVADSARPAWEGDAQGAAKTLLEYYANRAQPECRVYPEKVISTGVDQVLDNTFTFYGETHALGPEIDWEYNPGTNHWSHDLNRFTYLDLLVDEYLRTGERRYGRKAIDFILDWISKTDVCDAFISGKSPYVWGSYLNINGHLATWAGVLRALLPDGFVEPFELLRIIKSVHDQLAYLEIVIPEHSNNWVIFGARGMLATTLFFYELRDAERYIDYAWDRLLEQIDLQVLPDGVQFELTQHYHYGVAKSYATANILMMKSGRQAPEKSIEAVRNMSYYLEQTVTPERLHLAFNDSDANCGKEVAAFLCSPETDRARGNRSGRVTNDDGFEKLASEAFPYAGVYILRGRDHYLAFDGGPFGASHQHEDKLSFWLSAFGRSMIVDPGRFLYDESQAFRPYLLTTQAHNTITVDGLAQTSRLHRDSWVSNRRLPNYWKVSSKTTGVGASYDFGYGPDPVDVIHKRNVTFIGNEFFLIFDRLEGTGQHTFDLRFQFMPGHPETTDRSVRTTWDDANVLVQPFCTEPLSLSIHSGETDPVAGWYSVGYNRIEPAPQATFHGHASLPVEIVTLLYPYRGAVASETLSLEAVADGYRVTTPKGMRNFERNELARFSEMS